MFAHHCIVNMSLILPLFMCEWYGRFRLRVEVWYCCNKLYSQVSGNQPDLFPMSEIMVERCKSLNCLFECCRFS